MADNRIGVVRLLEQPLPNLPWLDWRNRLELVLVFQQFRQPLHDFVIRICDGELVDRPLQFALRFAEMRLEYPDEFLGGVSIPLLVGVDEQRGDGILGRA
ncbi:MAG: hypothetical protein ACI91T_000139 [Natronomonas sp.]